MARLVRAEFAGAIYHAIVRGNNRRDIFRDDKDRERFCARLGEYAEEYGVRVYAFCLMRNHVHVVLETPHANLERFMHKLQTAYAIYFNLRHGESGHLTQGRYHAKTVEGDDYLLKLARYVQLNPLFVGGMERRPLKERIQRLRAYRWSSYRWYLGKRAWEFVEEQPLLAMMPGRSEVKRRARFRQFVETGLAQSDDEFKVALKASPFGIGGEAFQMRMQDLHLKRSGKGSKLEDVSLRRRRTWVPADLILDAVCGQMGVARGELLKRRRNQWLRPVAGWVLGRKGGLTQRQIAGLLGIGTGKAISLQMERLRCALSTDARLAKLVKAIEDELAQAAKY